jgi:tetratricopeptide (TPR) repeat protein
MEEEDLLATLKSLQEAIHYSPDNLPLRTLYVDKLIRAGKSEDAMEELKGLVKLYPDNIQFRFLLSKIYLQRLEPSKGIVLIEGLVGSGRASAETTHLYIQLLIEGKMFYLAAAVYRDMIIRSPACRDMRIESQLGNFLQPLVLYPENELDFLLKKIKK